MLTKEGVKLVENYLYMLYSKGYRKIHISGVLREECEDYDCSSDCIRVYTMAVGNIDEGYLRPESTNWLLPTFLIEDTKTKEFLDYRYYARDAFLLYLLHLGLNTDYFTFMSDGGRLIEDSLTYFNSDLMRLGDFLFDTEDEWMIEIDLNKILYKKNIKVSLEEV